MTPLRLVALLLVGWLVTAGGGWTAATLTDHETVSVPVDASVEAPAGEESSGETGNGGRGNGQQQAGSTAVRTPEPTPTPVSTPAPSGSTPTPGSAPEAAT